VADDRGFVGGRSRRLIWVVSSSPFNLTQCAVVILAFIAYRFWMQLNVPFYRIRRLEAMTMASKNFIFNDDEYYRAKKDLEKKAPSWWRVGRRGGEIAVKRYGRR
jgi:hypothetical protein